MRNTYSRIIFFTFLFFAFTTWLLTSLMFDETLFQWAKSEYRINMLNKQFSLHSNILLIFVTIAMIGIAYFSKKLSAQNLLGGGVFVIPWFAITILLSIFSIPLLWGKVTSVVALFAILTVEISGSVWTLLNKNRNKKTSNQVCSNVESTLLILLEVFLFLALFKALTLLLARA